MSSKVSRKSYINAMLLLKLRSEVSAFLQRSGRRDLKDSVRMAMRRPLKRPGNLVAYGKFLSSVKLKCGRGPSYAVIIRSSLVYG